MKKCNFCMKRKTGRTSRKKTRKNISRKKQVSEVELLEMLIKKIVAKLEKNSWEAKVGDVLKAIQLKQKLAPTSEKSRISQAEKVFWEMIEEIRKEELSKLDVQPRGDIANSRKS